MRWKIAMFSMVACVLSSVSCSQPAPATVPVADTRDADSKAVRDIEEAWNKDFAAKDADKLLGHYTSDAALMVPGMPAVHGTEAIRGVIKEMIADPKLSLKFQSTRVIAAKSGDMVSSEGSYTMTSTNPKTKKAMDDKGSYVTVYQKQADGSWKAVSDIVTSEIPSVPMK